jgi:hypothetical protein
MNFCMPNIFESSGSSPDSCLLIVPQFQVNTRRKLRTAPLSFTSQIYLILLPQIGIQISDWQMELHPDNFDLHLEDALFESQPGNKLSRQISVVFLKPSKQMVQYLIRPGLIPIHILSKSLLTIIQHYLTWWFLHHLCATSFIFPLLGSFTTCLGLKGRHQVYRLYNLYTRR